MLVFALGVSLLGELSMTAFPERRFTFYWSPEGKKIVSYLATSLSEAQRWFKRDYKTSYAKYLGEVYVETL